MKGGQPPENLPIGGVMDEDKIAREMERRRQLADRNTGAVVELLRRREELRGIYPAADLVAENVGWVV
jgi:hypothetical protein